MPDKHDHLTSQIDEAFKARTERMIAGHWASQRKIFEAGYRAGYAAALVKGRCQRCGHFEDEHFQQPPFTCGLCDCHLFRATPVNDVDDKFIKQGKSTRKEQLRLKD